MQRDDTLTQFSRLIAWNYVQDGIDDAEWYANGAKESPLTIKTLAEDGRALQDQGD